MSTSIRRRLVALMAGAVAASASALLHGRDRGVNQPGAAGNTHRDVGINQPGAAGNRRRVR
ncbi:MAG: hypothetical protein M5U08_19915 [Burkholderiales bacterium]|nr:hypothetical protein [Burkholderiales bacterium]